MASSKLVPFSSFLPRTPLPTRKSPSLQVHLKPFGNPSALRVKTTQLTIPIFLPKISSTTIITEEEEEEEEIETPHDRIHESSDYPTVAFPSLKFSNIFFFSSGYNVQVIVGDNEHEESLVSRFRREVLKAGVLQECKRRRFFESSREKRKRKTREAARRNRKRRPPPRFLGEADKGETSKKKEDSEADNWEDVDVDLPYC
ncbi:hypothetical protein OROGR_031171 [Orobanche gracilis]